MGTLRLLLALAIVAFHAGPLFGGTWMAAEAVPAFFIISGFYMALILDGKYPRALDFYKSRFLRLFPVYWAFLLFMVAVAVTPQLPGEFGALLHYSARTGLARATDGSLGAWFAAIPNLFIFGADWVRQLVYDPVTGVTSVWRNGVTESQNVRGVYLSLLVPQNWSLAVELTFYLAAPFLARRATPTLVTICAAAFFIWFNVSHPLAFPHMLPFSNFWLFVLGMIAYRTLPTAQRWTAAQQAAVALIPFAVFVLWSPTSVVLAPVAVL